MRYAIILDHKQWEEIVTLLVRETGILRSNKLPDQANKLGDILVDIANQQSKTLLDPGIKNGTN